MPGLTQNPRLALPAQKKKKREEKKNTSANVRPVHAPRLRARLHSPISFLSTTNRRMGPTFLLGRRSLPCLPKGNKIVQGVIGSRVQVPRITNPSAVDAKYIFFLEKPSQIDAPPGSTVQVSRIRIVSAVGRQGGNRGIGQGGKGTQRATQFVVEINVRVAIHRFGGIFYGEKCIWVCDPWDL
ncbi:hypothetical protein GGTG_12425 [Gaeumannomyces tritici R3-111a-1]|uniref:Uncharacterized protein n=1 Tax=Gaeumannomyces tritici (strain R3-111a-1) TaxID=644352 RepID=J3PFZ9_GAET3|nr:hypothetical protein GGTG_12425 [Gaeumannomyces tritici R3-111a-1]EJT70252.1 hypothetical protein GGTG_12425 [Gaeumannomyces tritici R3-111a-1]